MMRLMNEMNKYAHSCRDELLIYLFILTVNIDTAGLFVIVRSRLKGDNIDCFEANFIEKDCSPLSGAVRRQGL